MVRSADAIQAVVAGVKTGIIHNGKKNTYPDRPGGCSLGLILPHEHLFTDLLETSGALIEAGYADQLLLSHDAGWYNPARPDGLPEGGFRGYTALTKEFPQAPPEPGIT